MGSRLRRASTAVLLAAIAGCGPLERGGQVAALGAILPLSGPEARSGECILEGMRLAARRRGPPVEILPRDAYGSTGAALRRLAELADQPRVVAVVGGWRAASGRPLAAAAAARGIPFVALSPLAAPQAVARGPQGLHRVSALGAAAARFAREDLSAKSAGLARVPGSDASATLASAFAQAFRGGGGVVRWTVEPDAAGKLAAPANDGEPVDVVWVAGPGSLVAQLADAPAASRAAFLIAEGWTWDNLEPLAGAGSKVYGLSWYSPNDPGPPCRDFIEACTSAGIVPTPAHALGWDFVNAARTAMEAEDASREGVARGLGGSAKFDGATGRLALGQGGETPAVSRVTSDGLRFLRRVGAEGAPALETSPADSAESGGA
jgi:branched-chain amino acid transport system substrate-binding protein